MYIKTKLFSALLTVSLVMNGLSMPVSAVESTKGAVISSNANTSTTKASSKSVTKAQKGVYTKSKLSWKNLKPAAYEGGYKKAWEACSKVPVQYAYNKTLGVFVFKNVTNSMVTLQVGEAYVNLGAFSVEVCEAPKKSKITVIYFEQLASSGSAKSVEADAFTNTDIVIDSIKSAKKGTKVTWHYKVPKGKYLAVNPYFQVYSKVDGKLVSYGSYYNESTAGSRLVRSSKGKYSMTLPIKCNKTTMVLAMVDASAGYLDASVNKDVLSYDISDEFEVKEIGTDGKVFELRPKTRDDLVLTRIAFDKFVAVGLAKGSDEILKGEEVYGTASAEHYNYFLSEHPDSGVLYVSFDVPVLGNYIGLAPFGEYGFEFSDVMVEQVSCKKSKSSYEISFKNSGNTPVFATNLCPLGEGKFPDLIGSDGEIKFSDGTVVKGDIYAKSLFLDVGESVTLKFRNIKSKNRDEGKWKFLNIQTEADVGEWGGYLDWVKGAAAISESSVKKYITAE